MTPILGLLVKWFRTAPRSQDDGRCNPDAGARILFAITDQRPSCLPVSTRPKVLDCRLCGDPASGFRFAFVEFLYQEDAFHALNLDGVIIGIFPLKVASSRTAIMPIKHSFLPQSEQEKEGSSRIVYCTNIRKTVTPDELINFCQLYFRRVSHVRLMGHDNHATKIAFVEFMEASGAIAALSSSGIYVKGHLIRVNPSKTPIRGCIYNKPCRDN